MYRAQFKCSSSRPISSDTTTFHRFCELKMLTFRSSYILHLPIVNTVIFVYRDNEAAVRSGRVRARPLKKHFHIISTKILVRNFWRWTQIWWSRMEIFHHLKVLFTKGFCSKQYLVYIYCFSQSMKSENKSPRTLPFLVKKQVPLKWDSVVVSGVRWILKPYQTEKSTCLI